MAAPALVVRIAGNLEDFRASLKGAQEQITTTTAGMQKLANSFQGERLVQHARNVSAAIEQVGVKTLNTAEAGRSLSVLERAMDKMLRTGQDIPVTMTKTAAELRRVAQVTDLADQSVSRITSNYRQFDGILQSLGINIGPYVKGLEDVTALVTKGIPGLGAFGAAVAVVGTAIGSWKLGEKIGELTGWTDEIARGTAVLRGYGDVAQQEMLARMQSLELMGQAEANWKRQKEGTEAATKATQEHTDELRREGMVTAGNAAHLEALANQMEKRQQQLKKDAEATRLAAHAQAFFGEKAHFTTEVIVEQTRAIDDHIKKIEEERQRVADFMNAPTLNDRASASTAFNLPGLTPRDILDIQREFDLGGAITGGDPTAALRQKLAQLEAKQGTYQIDNNREFFNMQREQALLAQLRMFFERGGRAFAEGGRNISAGWAMVGERGPEMVRLPGGSDVIPNSQLGGTTVNVTVNLQGTNIGTSFEFRKAVEDALVGVFRSGGLALPARV